MADEGRFGGKVVVVTGGAGGIGRAVCEGFADEGAAVAVVDVQGTEEAAAQAILCRGAGTASGRFR